MLSRASQSQTVHPPSNPLRENVERLSALIHRDVYQSRRGNLATEFKDLITPYLITDVASDQLLQIQRAAHPYPKRSALPATISHDTFKDFLVTEGPILQDRYLEFKARGHTGCAVLSDEVTHRLNRIVRNSAIGAMTPDGLHFYTRVSLEGREHWLDFTIDQFVAYSEIIAYTGYNVSDRKLSRTDDYVGTLVMPAVFD